MSKEKIAFVLPVYDNTEAGQNRPLLVFTADAVPVVTHFYFAVFMLGLTNGEKYWLSPSIMFCEENELVKVHEEKGTWIRARTVIGEDDNVATAINLHFNNAKFDRAGQYYIKVTLSDGTTDFHENGSYFEVILNSQGNNDE